MAALPRRPSRNSVPTYESVDLFGVEVRNFFDEQFQIFVARVDDRLNSQTEVFGAKMDLEREILGTRLDLQKEMLASQTEILNVIRTLQAALVAPRVIVEDANGRPAGIRILS
jgi:hypothetical protein